MAACVDNSRNQAPNSPFSSNSNPCPTNISLCRLIKFCKPNIPNLVPCRSIHRYEQKSSKVVPRDENEDGMWLKIRDEAKLGSNQEPILSKYYHTSILSHSSLDNALASHLAIKLSTPSLSSDVLYQLFATVLTEDCEIRGAIRDDLQAVKDRDPACISYVHCLLNFKGFLACQAHRVAHKLWSQGRAAIALLIQNRVSEVFAVDIHPGVKMGRGILLDHATGIVIGETAVIGNNVSILHNVTLGATGKVAGDRHPKIGDEVVIGAGTKILGNLRIGEGAKIGAGSVVLKEVPCSTTAVGNPARLIQAKDRTKM